MRPLILTMPRSVKVLLIGVLAMVVWAPNSFADESRETLSLEQALAIGYWHSPEMMEARKAITATKGKLLQAKALPNPEVEFDMGGLKQHRGEGNSQIRRAHFDQFTIKQPLDPLGTRFLQGQIAHNEVDIAQGELQSTWAGVRAEIIKTHAEILAQEEAVRIAEDNLNMTKQFLARVQTRFQSGNAFRNEVLRAQIEVFRAENELLVSEKNLKISKSTMNLLLGRAVETSIAFSDTLAYQSPRYEYAQVKEQALHQRTDIRNETIRLDSKKKEHWRALLKTVFPQTEIGVQRTTQDFNNDTSLVFQASYPFWGFNSGETQETQAEQEKQQIVLDALKGRVTLQVYQAFLEVELADKQVSLQKRALEEANELLAQATMKYEEGEIPFLGYLENIKTIKETRLNYFNSLKEYNGKLAELEKAIQVSPTPEGEQQ